MLLRSLLVLLACLSLAFVATPAQAQQVQLAWDAPVQADGTPVPNLAGYKLYSGAQSGQYQTMVPVGLTTTYTVTSLSAGQTYYFAVKAYNTTGTESPFSNEVSVTASSAQISATPATLTAGGTVTAAWSGIAAPTATDWIGLYSAGAAHTAYIDWMYVSCSKTSSTPRALGSFPTRLSSDLQPYYYAVKAYNTTGTESLFSHEVSVTASSAQISATPATLTAGGTVTAAW